MFSRFFYFMTALWILLSLGRSFAQAEENGAALQDRDHFPAVEGKAPAEKKSAPVAIPANEKRILKGLGDVKKEPKKSSPSSCGSVFGEKSSPSKTTKSADKKSELPLLLAEVEKKYNEGKSLSAKFNQVQTNALTKIKSTTSGTIQFKRPDKVRWDTTAPEDSRSLLVGNGVTYWFYRPPFDESEKGQVMIQKASQVQSKLAQLLLSGAFSQAKGVTIKADMETEFTLAFSGSTAGTAKSAILTVDPEEKIVRKVVINNKDGNVSEIALSEIKVGENLRDDLFHYDIPANVDVIKN